MPGALDWLMRQLGDDQASQSNGVQEPMVRQDAQGNWMPYTPPSTGDALQKLQDTLGVTDLTAAKAAFDRGEYPQALGQGVWGAGQLAGAVAPAVGAVGKFAPAVGRALPSLLVDEVGALKLPRSAGKGVQTANPDIAAPQIGKGSDAPLFDYGLVTEEPPAFVPQVGLPRMAGPAKGVPAHYQAVASPENVDRMKADIETGIKQGGLKWFHPGPLYDAWGGQLGEEGPSALRQYMESLGGTTNLSKVPANIKNASYHYWLWRNGMPVPETSAEIAPGYGHIAQNSHLENMRQIREGTFSSEQNPKPPSFTENSLGNYEPVTWDQRMGVFGNLRDTKGKYVTAPDQNKYSFLENTVQGIAKDMKISPAGAQASGWLTTGDAYENKTLAQLMEDVIRQSAAKYGISPQAMRDRFIAAKDPLKAIAPIAAPLGLLELVPD